jgi:hypothetical protein
MEALRAQTTALRQQGADLILCVAHTDRDMDNQIVRSRLVDVLLTGHDHDLAIGYDGKTVMVESSEEGNFVTAIDFVATVTGEGKDRKVAWAPSFRVHDSSTIDPDPEVLAVVKRYEAALSKELDVEIGTSATELDSRSATVRSQEAAIGNLIADAIRESTGGDVAITNGGGIRANKQYPAGVKLTRRDILSELPFGNSTSLVEVTGADIKAALENGVSQIEQRAGRFPQVSGLKFEVDPKAAVGSRVSNIQVNGEALDPAKRYKVATNNFMLTGGDGYVPFTRGPRAHRHHGRQASRQRGDVVRAQEGHRGSKGRRPHRRPLIQVGPVSKAVADFRDSPQADGWRRLPFFQGGAADAGRGPRGRAHRGGRAGAAAARRHLHGSAPRAPRHREGRDPGPGPLPDPGDSHGLAFSYRGPRRLPASLKIIFKELAADLGIPEPRTGDLSSWAKQGVLCLNTALTVEAGQAGAHLKFGWSQLADEAMAAVSAERPPWCSCSGAHRPASARRWWTAPSTSCWRAATPPPQSPQRFSRHAPVQPGECVVGGEGARTDRLAATVIPSPRERGEVESRNATG